MDEEHDGYDFLDPEDWKRVHSQTEKAYVRQLRPVEAIVGDLMDDAEVDEFTARAMIARCGDLPTAADLEWWWRL